MLSCSLFPLFFFPFLWLSHLLGCYITLAPSDFPQGLQAQFLPLSNAAHASLFSPRLLVADASVWATSPQGVAVMCIICGLYLFIIFLPGYVALWDSKTLHRHAAERISWCLETSLLRLPPRDGSPSLTLLSLFLSFIFCSTSFWRQWAACLVALCPSPAFRSCFVVFAQHSNDLLMNLWCRKWSPHPVPLPS